MLWIELTTAGGQTIWVNLATYRTMQRAERDNATHLISLSHNSEGQPEITTVTQTPEEILKLAGLSKKSASPDAAVGFFRHASEEQ